MFSPLGQNETIFRSLFLQSFHFKKQYAYLAAA